MFPPIVPRDADREVGYMDNFPQLVRLDPQLLRRGRKRRATPRARARQRALGRSARHHRGDADPGRLLPGLPDVRGLLPAGRPARHRDRLGVIATNHPTNRRGCSPSVCASSSASAPPTRSWKPGATPGWSAASSCSSRCDLPVASDVANDPFFGRAGKMMAASQRDQRLKFEILCPVISLENPTAICSFNWHQDHFSGTFDISDGRW